MPTWCEIWKVVTEENCNSENALIVGANCVTESNNSEYAFLSAITILSDINEKDIDFINNESGSDLSVSSVLEGLLNISSSNNVSNAKYSSTGEKSHLLFLVQLHTVRSTIFIKLEKKQRAKLEIKKARKILKFLLDPRRRRGG